MFSTCHDIIHLGIEVEGGAQLATTSLNESGKSFIGLHRVREVCVGGWGWVGGCVETEYSLVADNRCLYSANTTVESAVLITHTVLQTTIVLAPSHHRPNSGRKMSNIMIMYHRTHFC